MTHQLPRLLLTTALCLPIASAAFAQSETACDDLQTALNDGLPPALSGDMQRITDVQGTGDAAACETELAQVRSASETESTDATAQNEATLADTDQLTVTLEDQMTVQGMVYLDRQPANVDIQGGAAEVTVSNDQPDVTVNEGQANIVIRQVPANVVVEMPQPTIRIEQPAPEIIITMPAPGVDVANTRPKVEVRQADPTVTVTQSAPMVELELQRVPEGQEPQTTVTDRASGNTYAAGVTGEASTLEDATVNMAQQDPTVVYKDGEPKTPTVNRTEPTVTFEAAQPKVQVTSNGEPQIEMVQTGEPKVTFQEADAGNDDTAQPAASASSTEKANAASTNNPDGMQTENADATQTDADAAATMGTDTPAMDPSEADNAAADPAAPTTEGLTPITEGGDAAMASSDGTAAPASDVTATDATADASSDTAATTDTQTADTAPAVTRDGYTVIPVADMNIDNLRGMKVYGTNDEDVGDVGEVLTATDGSVESLVLQVGGFLGLGERSVNVPMSLLTVLGDGNGDVRVYVDATEDRLENMPKYDG